MGLRVEHGSVSVNDLIELNRASFYCSARTGAADPAGDSTEPAGATTATSFPAAGSFASAASISAIFATAYGGGEFFLASSKFAATISGTPSLW